jgi:erythronate-4-phosphate dehydrogenase
VARALGMNVLLNDPPRQRIEGRSDFVTFDTILKEADIITIHVPLNKTGEDKTYHLFCEEVFSRTFKQPWLINSSRGEVVETLALKKALKSQLIKGAILDVWENEPDIDQKLLTSVFLATPHIAGYSTDGKANGTSMIVNALCNHFGLPLYEWYPGNVPPPPVPYIEISGIGKSDEDIVREAVIHTYDIAMDDRNLRDSVSSFEKQRGDYRLRREFGAYRVRLEGGSETVNKVLEELGFKLY